MCKVNGKHCVKPFDCFSSQHIVAAFHLLMICAIYIYENFVTYREARSDGS